MRRRTVTALWICGLLSCGVLVVKTFVADVYRVDSGSMRPTLFGGRTRPDDPSEDNEHVLVRYARDLQPERFDLVVSRSAHDDVPLVKRAAGLPLETVAVRDGDLVIGGELLAPDAPRPRPIPVYDERWLDPLEYFERREDGSVRREDGAWVVDGSASAPGNRLLYHLPLRDDYLDHAHRRVPGVVEVNDAWLELEFLLEEPGTGACFHFELMEAGDTFTLELAAARAGHAGLRLTRRNARLQASTPSEEVLLETSFELAPGRWHALRFGNIDNALHVVLPGADFATSASYATNEPLPGVTSLGQHFGPRVAFGIQDGRARFRAVRILRDLFYTSAGQYGTQRPVTLGPDEYFLLGDNSAVSTDSRQNGPVPGRWLLGSPLAVLWPDPRWLEGAERP